VSLIEGFLRSLKERKASALHLAAGRRPMLRVEGVTEPIQGETLLDDLALRGLLRELLGESRWEAFQDDHDADFAFSAGPLGRYQGNCVFTDGGLAAVFEPIGDAPESLDQLGLPAIGQSLVNARSGLILVCGPHGAGKSTTIASLIDHINAKIGRAHV
jgi:twitching motility protein PilT